MNLLINLASINRFGSLSFALSPIYLEHRVCICVYLYYPLPEFLSILCAVAPHRARAHNHTLSLERVVEWHEISQLNVSQAEYANLSSRDGIASLCVSVMHSTPDEMEAVFACNEVHRIAVISEEKSDTQMLFIENDDALSLVCWSVCIERGAVVTMHTSSVHCAPNRIGVRQCTTTLIYLCITEQSMPALNTVPENFALFYRQEK